LLRDQISDEEKDFWDDYCLWNIVNIAEKNKLKYKFKNINPFKHTEPIIH
jgi:hypothetical protein